MKKTLVFLLLLVTASLLQACGAATTLPPGTTSTSTSATTVTTMKTYANPVFEPVLADPSVIQGDDGYYYVFGTQDYGQWNGAYGTKYVPILRSADLVTWEYAGSAFTMATRPIWGTANAGLWAPHVVKLGDVYNLYYSLSTWGDPNPGIGVATAVSPLGPWTDHGKLFDSNSIGVNNSIDPDVFVGADGHVYMVWGSFRGIYGVELTSDGLALQNPETAFDDKVLLAGYETSAPWNGSTYEGAYVIFENDYYYLFLSSGSCCDGYNSSYNVKVGRSASPLGPYVDHLGRAMTAGNRGYQVLIGSAYFAGPGHNSLVQDEAGDWWIVYHAFDLSEPAYLGSTNRRSLMIDAIVWSDEGWPSVFGTMPSNRAVLAPII